VARQTRAQRRARREAQQASAPQAAVAGGPPTAPPARPTARGGAQPQPRRQPSDRSERRLPGAGAKNFVAESWGELKKVEWPNQKQLIQGVVVVLVACFVVGVYLYGADLVFKRLVENVFLR
jgi:preprotein translocase subunit SecE